MSNIDRGAYVLKDVAEEKVILIATGSEVSLAFAAAQELDAQGIPTRVVSMPSADKFELQDAAYRQAVLPSTQRCRVAIEAAHPDYWRKWVGLDGEVVGLASFGESGPGGQVMEHFGFSVSNVVAVVKGLI